MAAHKSHDAISRVLDNFDVTTALKNEVNEIENVLSARGDLNDSVRNKIQDVLMLSRKLKSDDDPDIPLILRAIYQLRGMFNPNFRSTMKPMVTATAAQRNAERTELLRMLDSGNLNREQFNAASKRIDELNVMTQSDKR